MAQRRDADVLAVPGPSGDPIVYARVPRIARHFQSTLHDVANVPPRLAGWRSELSHFLAGRAPVAQLVEESVEPDAAAELRRAVIDALEQGFGGGVAVDVTGATTGMLAMPDAIAETADLAALRHDWLWWLDAAGALSEDARGAVAWAVDELARRTYASYIWSLPVMSSRDIAEAIQYGIVVGDDPAMSCAAVLRRLTGEPEYWQEV